MRGTFKALGVAASLLAVAGAATAAAPTTVLARAGGSFDQRDADEKRCVDIAREAKVEDLPSTGAMMPSGGGGEDLATAAGSIIGMMIGTAINNAKSRRLGAHLCLHNLGYAEVPLTADEAAAYDRLNGSAKDEWEKTFLAKDLSSRVGAIIDPKVPLFPDYPTQAFVSGGLRLDPASFKGVSGNVAKAGVILSGKARRNHTAVLLEPFELSNENFSLTGTPSSVFHMSDYRLPRDPLLRVKGSTWCGMVMQKGQEGPAVSRPYCFTSHEDGYEARGAVGYGWMTGIGPRGFLLPPSRGRIVLSERAQDDLEPVDFELRFDQIQGAFVELTAVAKHAGQEVEFWAMYVKLQSGQGVLPLWSSRLALKRIDKNTITATLTGDGNGQGWNEEYKTDPPPSRSKR